MYNNRVFKVVYDPNIKQYYVLPHADRFVIPNKIYGNLTKLANRVWNSYVIDKKTTGVLLVGDQGSGKTLVGNIISNIAIDNNLPVVMVSEIDPDEKLIAYLTKLNKCVLYLDEFSKVFGYWSQKLMLTMLSDPFNTQKLFILTENNTTDINRFILNRPGRIKYRFDFNKLEKDVLLDFCKDYKVKDDMLKDLLLLYDKSPLFTFDFLSAIVDEHHKFPEDNLDQLLDSLNLKILKIILFWKLVSVTDMQTNKNVNFDREKANKKGLGINSFKAEYTEFSYNVSLEVESDNNDNNNNTSPSPMPQGIMHMESFYGNNSPTQIPMSKSTDNKYNKEIYIVKNRDGSANFKLLETTNQFITLECSGYIFKFELME